MDYQQAHDNLFKHKHIALFEQLQEIEMTFQIFQANYVDLAKLFDVNVLYTIGIPTAIHYRISFNRHLFNYLTSSFALHEHLRKHQQLFRDAFIGNRFNFTGYNESMCEYCFIKQLRNYLVHHKIMNTHLTGLISVQELKKWPDWNKKSNQYLDDCSTYVDIRQVSKNLFDYLLSKTLWHKIMLHDHHQEVYESLDQAKHDYLKANLIKRTIPFLLTFLPNNKIKIEFTLQIYLTEKSKVKLHKLTEESDERFDCLIRVLTEEFSLEKPVVDKLKEIVRVYKEKYLDSE